MMYLMDPSGDFMKFYPQMTEAPEMAESMAGLMREHLGTARPKGLLTRLLG